MKLLLDQNLSHHLVSALQTQFPGSAHVRDFSLQRADDVEIWELARRESYIIVSKDGDFHQRSFLYGAPPKVVWLKLGNCSTVQVRDVLVARRVEIGAFATHDTAAFLVLA